jgi:cell wall hydrolase
MTGRKLWRISTCLLSLMSMLLQQPTLPSSGSARNLKHNVVSDSWSRSVEPHAYKRERIPSLAAGVRCRPMCLFVKKKPRRRMTNREALALTIWGEARGEPIEGKVGVAMVMRNRLRAAYRGATSYVAVCTAHAQFSAWTQEAAKIATEAALLSEGRCDLVLKLCLEVADATIAGKLADNTGGANHYYATTIEAPDWAAGLPTVQLGNQVFLSTP